MGYKLYMKSVTIMVASHRVSERHNSTKSVMILKSRNTMDINKDGVPKESTQIVIR